MNTLIYELMIFAGLLVASVMLVTLAFSCLKPLAAKYLAALSGVLVLLWLYQSNSQLPALGIIGMALITLIAAVIFIGPIRKRVFMQPMLKYFRAVLPPMSDTEREALEAGTVWWEPELFSGFPNWKKLTEVAPAQLSVEEQAFIDGPVEAVCAKIDDWKIYSELQDLPPEVWTMLAEEGFFGMIIPKEYGGLGFSAYGHSAVVTKIASRSGTAAVTTMVPNSLGPGQLLMEYGTQAQRDYFLPRLAKGVDIPCFALTEPTAGSDAAGMLSEGVVCKKHIDGEETIGIQLNWNKRYITLAPVASLLGLAFKLYDPDGLLGDKENIGITLALIPTNTQGVTIGDRHIPVGVPFMNGPIQGDNVFITLDQIIGGREYVGQGWRMLMECLSDGRGISLPSLSVAAGKFASMHTGAYARVRSQFNVAIADFEGIQEALATIAGNTYLMDAVRHLTTATIDRGEKPSVASAIAKYHLTERMRDTINAAVDIHGGSAICMGPKNQLGRSYQGIPISITVEGANILTRSLIIFGQGSVRSHPWILKSMEAAMDTDNKRALKNFDYAISRHATMFMSSLSKSLLCGFSEKLFAEGVDDSSVSHHYQKLSHLSASFAFIADVMMLRFGGDLKRLEYYSCLLGDLLSYLYMGSAVLKHYRSHGERQDDLPLLEWSMHECYRQYHIAMTNILDNCPLGGLTPLLKRVVYPLGVPAFSRNRKIEKAAAHVITRQSATRDALIDGIYQSAEKTDPLGRMEYAFHTVLKATSAERQFKQAVRELDLDLIDFSSCLKTVVEQGKLSEQDAQLVNEAHLARMDAIQVDSFAKQHWLFNDSEHNNNVEAA